MIGLVDYHPTDYSLTSRWASLIAINPSFFIVPHYGASYSSFVSMPHGWTITGGARFSLAPACFTDMVAYDYLVNRLLDHLDKLGVAGNTLLQFTGDNNTDRSLQLMLGYRVIRGGKADPDNAGTPVPLFARCQDRFRQTWHLTTWGNSIIGCFRQCYQGTARVKFRGRAGPRSPHLCRSTADRRALDMDS